ncbi:MAG: hypothetical protein VXW84_08965, partial [Verrucomicrobiota bacterium]|nr:hypothetical protein [Verrucomicrobiota bacterium]
HTIDKADFGCLSSTTFGVEVFASEPGWLPSLLGHALMGQSRKKHGFFLDLTSGPTVNLGEKTKAGNSRERLCYLGEFPAIGCMPHGISRHTHQTS